MNYSALAKKYVPGAKFKLIDRSYDGLEWIGPGEKPSIEMFQSWATEEARLQRIDEVKVLARMKEIEAARNRELVKIAEETKSIEEKLKDEFKEMRRDILSQFHETKELEQCLNARDALSEVWVNVSSLQHAINEECKQYLADTDFYVTRKQETGQEIPQNVSHNRQTCRDRVNNGVLAYASWSRIRGMERPSRKDIQEALKNGRGELARLREICNSIALRYPKPRIKE